MQIGFHSDELVVFVKNPWRSKEIGSSLGETKIDSRGYVLCRAVRLRTLDKQLQRSIVV